MNPDELEELLRDFLRGIQEVMQSGEILNDEFQGQIADTLNNMSMRIDELRAQAPQQPTSNQPPTEGANLGAPPSPDAQLLWILAGQQEQAFISYLREYPGPATQSLLNNPSELARTIDYLSQMMPQGAPDVVDGIQHSDLNSSNIWGTAYNPSTGQMKVRFQGGAEYEYDGVPQNIYRAFSKGNATAKTTGSNEYGAWFKGKNPSMGAAMNQYIKAGGFNYRRLN